MIAKHVHTIAEAVVDAVLYTLPGADITVDNIQSVTVDGSGDLLTLDVTWIARRDGARTLRLGCPR